MSHAVIKGGIGQVVPFWRLWLLLRESCGIAGLSKSLFVNDLPNNSDNEESNKGW